MDRRTLSASSSPRKWVDQQRPRRLSLSISAPPSPRGDGHTPRILAFLSPRAKVSLEHRLREQIHNLQAENDQLESASEDLKNRVHQLTVKVYLLEEIIVTELPDFGFKRSVLESELAVIPP